jgi:hypothetical protein
LLEIFADHRAPPSRSTAAWRIAQAVYRHDVPETREFEVSQSDKLDSVRRRMLPSPDAHGLEKQMLPRVETWLPTFQQALLEAAVGIEAERSEVYHASPEELAVIDLGLEASPWPLRQRAGCRIGSREVSSAGP